MTNPVVKWYFWGVERPVKGSPDMIRIQYQRFSKGTGEKMKLQENILCRNPGRGSLYYWNGGTTGRF